MDKILKEFLNDIKNENKAVVLEGVNNFMQRFRVEVSEPSIKKDVIFFSVMENCGKLPFVVSDKIIKSENALNLLSIKDTNGNMLWQRKNKEEFLKQVKLMNMIKDYIKNKKCDDVANVLVNLIANPVAIEKSEKSNTSILRVIPLAIKKRIHSSDEKILVAGLIQKDKLKPVEISLKDDIEVFNLYSNGIGMKIASNIEDNNSINI